MSATKSKRKFKSELSQILKIITHSLYSHNEVFLRELISNASDAIDKARFRALQDDSLHDGDKDWKIKLIPDEEAGTLTVRDNGVGMSREEAVESLGTIAKSGTKAFLEALQQADAAERPELIGQFGVGFYAAFMVAERVTVLSRPLDGDASDGIKWVSDGQSAYTVEPYDKPTRGTDVVLHLTDEAKEYLEEWKLREVVKEYSDFIEHPVVMDVQEEGGEPKEEVLNAREALWLRDKDDISEDDYANFYKQISGDTEPPAKVIHYRAEGTLEFNVLLFVPSHRTFDLMFGEPKIGPRLYIKRVQVMDHCEQLLPPYLRFVKGVVDCADLPLNISRETLQDNPLLGRIRKNVVKNAFKALEEMKSDNYETYKTVYAELGEILKEGLAQDFANRESIADLLLFESINTDKGAYTTLADYVEKMPEGQSAIYYLTGERRERIERSPALEAFRARGWDVLLLTDPVDEFVIPYLDSYREKPLKAANQGELDSEVESDESKTKEEFLPLFERLRKSLGVAEVRPSRRLKQSAACLVHEEGAISPHMRHILKQMGQDEGLPEQKRILELNPEHTVVKTLRDLHGVDPDDPRVESYGRLLHDQALIAEGSPLPDPAEFTQRLNDLLVRDALAS